MKLLIVALPILMAAFFTQALADPASDLWVKGKYGDAIKEAQVENSPEASAIAARAAVAYFAGLGGEGLILWRLLSPH